MRDESVSCVIPCYNCGKYVAQTIESLMHQTVKPAEIILINDASTDDTLDILRETAKKHQDIIKIIDWPENKGAAYARNLGVQNAAGDYILFMDADDLAEPTLIAGYQHRLKKLNNEAGNRYILCYSAYIQIDEKDNQISEIVRGIQVNPEEVLGYFFVRNPIITTSGVLVEKAFLIKAGGFNPQLKYSEDWDLWIRLASLGGFAYVDEPLIKVRRHQTNMSASVAKMLEGEKSILTQYSLDYIKNAVYKRKLSVEENVVDYVSILNRIGCWDQGLAELNSLLEQGGSSYSLYLYLGLYYLKHNMVETALEYFEKTLALDSSNGAALNNAGALYLIKGNKAEAEKYLRSAIDCYPGYRDAAYNMQLLHKENVLVEDVKFTWRQLRKVLTYYQS